MRLLGTCYLQVTYFPRSSILSTNCHPFIFALIVSICIDFICKYTIQIRKLYTALIICDKTRNYECYHPCMIFCIKRLKTTSQPLSPNCSIMSNPSILSEAAVINREAGKYGSNHYEVNVYINDISNSLRHNKMNFFLWNELSKINISYHVLPSMSDLLHDETDYPLYNVQPVHL